MKPTPKKFDLTQGAPFRVHSVTTPPRVDALGSTGPLIAPKGPRLTLEPIGAMLFVDMPNENEEQTAGGIHLPPGSMLEFQQYRVAQVVSVGPDVRHVKATDRILVHRAQVDQVVHDGNSYWRTREDAVAGIVR